ncbi:nitroreductase / dihydropteridine reductase [Arachidicoccus rhizosphaerae]|jgi:nitroreductase/dihydropteridine reductase|uniref:Nitroreductase / dihydropteridine reductase n=1 Tax=Arachidicoccus rhizosphaerae TaxID=551991 RepID=A0A1H3Y0M3_9BACT|nr:NAD(P)H-dependent oxidoreductase [Arachidicoccus rhizosphaerae]SEA05133.1 nitroreductase / dihydropteridine reductase [Arachidicoccus rhizosphaerae]
MSFLELAKNRYTTKKYDAAKKIDPSVIAELQEILRLTPSSINSQPWKFVFVGESQLKARLAAVSYFNEEKINQASHLVVFSGLDNVEQFEQQIHRHLPEGAVAYYNQMLKPLGDSSIKAWLNNQVYIALGFFLSAAAHLGLDSTPMEGIQAAAYREILGLPHHQPLFAVALGYRHPEDKNQPGLAVKSRIQPADIIDTY